VQEIALSRDVTGTNVARGPWRAPLVYVSLGIALATTSFAVSVGTVSRITRLSQSPRDPSKAHTSLSVSFGTVLRIVRSIQSPVWRVKEQSTLHKPWLPFSNRLWAPGDTRGHMSSN